MVKIFADIFPLLDILKVQRALDRSIQSKKKSKTRYTVCMIYMHIVYIYTQTCMWVFSYWYLSMYIYNVYLDFVKHINVKKNISQQSLLAVLIPFCHFLTTIYFFTKLASQFFFYSFFFLFFSDIFDVKLLTTCSLSS